MKNAVFALLEKGAGMILALGTVMLLLRGLSKADFAAWGLFLVLSYFIEMGRSGLLQNGMVRYLALHQGIKGQQIRSAALFMNLIYSFCTNLALWGMMGWIIHAWQAPQLATMLPVFFVANVVSGMMAHFNFIQQAHHSFSGIFWSNLAQKGTLFAWVFWCKLTSTRLELEELVWAMCLGACLGSAISWHAARQLSEPVRWFKRPERYWLHTLSQYGKWVLGTNLSTMFYKNIDKLVLGYMLGPSAFAVYDAAGKVTQLVEAPSFSIASVVFPQGALRMKNEGTAGIKRLYERSVGSILALILPFIVLVLAFAEPLIRLIAGPGYTEGANILRITAFFGLFLPFAVQFGTVLDATGKPEVNFRYTCFTAVLNLGLSMVFIPASGLSGAATATLAGYAISFVLMQLYLKKEFGIQALQAFSYVPEFYKTGLNILKSKLEL
ncbi:MAG: flippase [Saprospiraceae bacterium]|nr:flippase [Saprospiraceae bacterium]